MKTPEKGTDPYVIDRPLVLPSGILQSQGVVKIDLLSHMQDIVSIEWRGSIGLSDDMELGLALPVFSNPSLNSFELGEVQCFGVWAWLDDPNEPIRIALRGTLAAFISKKHLQWMGTDFVLGVDALSRYHLSNRFALAGDVWFGLASGDGVVAFLFVDTGIVYQVNKQIAIEGLIGIRSWIANDSQVLFPTKFRLTYALGNRPGSGVRSWILRFEPVSGTISPVSDRLQPSTPPLARFDTVKKRYCKRRGHKKIAAAPVPAGTVHDTEGTANNAVPICNDNVCLRLSPENTWFLRTLRFLTITEFVTAPCAVPFGTNWG